MKTYLTLIAYLFIMSCGVNKTDRSARENSIDEKLKPLIAERTVLELRKSENKQNTQFISHFGGEPYFEKGETWPVNTETNKPLSFVFQIINIDGIQLPGEIAIMQFFYDWEKFPWETSEPGWLVKTYSKVDTKNAVKLIPDTSIFACGFCEIVFHTEKSLPDWEGIFNIDKSIVGLSEKENKEEPWAAYDETVNRLIGEQFFSSYFGGYPKWIQGDYTPDVIGKKFKFLCQINSEDNANIMWGDMGSIYFFYNSRNLSEFEFILQCY